MKNHWENRKSLFAQSVHMRTPSKRIKFWYGLVRAYTGRQTRRNHINLNEHL